MSGKVTLTAAGPSGWYDVLVDGTKIGQVRKHEQRFNLRRPVVVRGWMVAGYIGTWRTRAEAVDELLRLVET